MWKWDTGKKKNGKQEAVNQWMNVSSSDDIHEWEEVGMLTGSNLSHWEP